MATKTAGLLGTLFFAASGAVLADGASPEIQAHCMKISKQYQAAAMIREEGVTETDAFLYMERLKNVDDRDPMKAAVVAAYEVYSAYNSNQISVVAYRQCLIDNNVVLIPKSPPKPPQPIADGSPPLDQDGNIALGNAPKYIGESPKKLLPGKWDCQNYGGQKHWTEIYGDTNRFVMESREAYNSGKYDITGSVASRRFDRLPGKEQFAGKDDRVLLYFTSPNYRVSNLDKQYSECARVAAG